MHKRTFRQLAAIALLSSGLTVLALLISAGGVFSTWALDWLWGLNGPFKTLPGDRTTIGDQVVIVAIDEATLRRYRGDHPRLPRDVYASVIETAAGMGARLVGLDITFDERTNPDADQALANAAGSTGKVVTNCFLANNEDFSKIWISGRSFFWNQTRGEGFADFPLDLDRDHFIRRVRLFYPRGDLACRISFALALYLADIGAKPEEVVYDRSSIVLPRPGGFAPIRLPLDYRGLSLVGFLGGAKSLPTVSAADLIEGKVPAEAIRDKVVLVGGTAAEFRDSFHTPFSPKGDLPGVELHGHLLENLFAGKMLREISGPTWWGLLLLIAACSGALTGRLRPVPGGIALAIGGAGMLPLTLWLFVGQSVFINPFDVWTVLAISWACATAADSYFLQGEKNTIARLFRQYVSPNLLNELLEHPEAIALGGARRQAVVMFADVRGFTSICERCTPEEVISFLNIYFNEVTKVIFTHGGIVDKYIGDGLMAFFGVPIFHEDASQRAVEAGIAMQHALRELQSRHVQPPFPIERIGIGIHGGEVLVGNVGSEQHQEYTLLGDVVNISARLESLSTGGEILISGWIKEHIPVDRFTLNPRGPLKVKGRKAEVEAFEVIIPPSIPGV
ncbi:MAG: adenylate/guanylate cyclase domain-containing protein [Candidatus Ozemobacteraceae bacterium]